MTKFLGHAVPHSRDNILKANDPWPFGLRFKGAKYHTGGIDRSRFEYFVV